MSVATDQRFRNRHSPCPICGGWDAMDRGQEKRCAGYLSSDGLYAHCTRENFAGDLRVEDNGTTYAHRLRGSCKCGVEHSPDNRAAREEPARYVYRSHDGRDLFRVCILGHGKNRPRPPWQEHPDGSGGWTKGRNGAPLVLYRLPDLLASTGPIYLVEGERDVETLRAMGLTATTTAQGASSWRHTAEHACQYLANRDVVVIRDKDAAGLKYALDAYKSLYPVVRTIATLECPVAKDITDHINAGGTMDQLVEMQREASSPEPDATPDDWREAPFADEGADDSEHYPHATADQLGRASNPGTPARPDVHILTADEFFEVESAGALVVPALGICPGPPTGLIGQAYVGKTFVGLSLGMSVAAGKPAWGTFVTKAGPWLHLDYEQGKRHTRSRIRRMARGMGITDDDFRALVADNQIRVAVYPGLYLGDADAIEHFTRLFEGISLVTCDSLRVMLGGVDENSSQVRKLMSVISIASNRTGAAPVLLLHAGKTPIDGSARPRKEMARGSSAIMDEMQSAFVMTKPKGEHTALVTHEKDRELGQTVSDFGLRIEDVPSDSEERDPKWGVRVVHVDRAEMAAAKAPTDAQFKQKQEAVRKCIEANPGVAGKKVVAELTRLKEATVRACVDQLIADGTVVETKAPKNGRRLYLPHAVPRGELHVLPKPGPASESE